TQNIDNLHTVAGSTRVLELHGNIFRTKCFTDDKIVEHPLDTDDIPPLCPRCCGYVRPDVVWFGELLPEKIFEQSMHAASNTDVFLCIGTSGVVYPAAGLPIHARQSGALLIDINPETTPISEQAAYHIQGTSGPILTQLFEKVTGHFMESRT
ncbi:MAG TPA: Sir2 family NAD-dependent protein deacetylase, partial [bacterium]|nr:Sir2 family NAD-dependent protein deacetylase [bacterium]